MRRLPVYLSLALVPLVSPLAVAGDLNVSVRSGGQSAIQVGPGASVNYEVIGELSDGSNQGLAMFSFDLVFSGGPLTQANTPGNGPILPFVSPLGLNNPAGFGGTVVGGTLRQVGGAQNTINNVFAPFPSGTVTTGIALPGQPEVLASGTLTAPANPGTYTLSLSGLFANVIRDGATGFPFWEVDAAGVGTITNLTVEVKALTASASTVSLSSPSTVTFNLDAGTANAGRSFWVLGSATGTSPGIPVDSVTIPLTFDFYTNITITSPNSALLRNSLGTLNSAGKATAKLVVPPGLPPTGLVGLTLYHAYALFPPVDYASNPVPVLLVP